MKNLSLLLITLFIPFLVSSQVCVTLYNGDDYGLEDRENRIVAMEVDRNGDIWFGATGPLFRDLGKFDGQNWSKLSVSLLPDPRPVDFAFDSHDSIWIATNKGLGIFHIDSMKGRIMTPTNSDLPEANVTAIAIDSNDVKWIGFSSGKVASFDGVSFTVHKEWNNSPVNTIEIAYDSSVWVGLQDSPGVVWYKNGAWTQISSIKSVPAIESDKWGRIMIASGDSMILYTGSGTRTIYTEPGNTIRDLAVRKNSGIWASSARGLMVRVGNRFVVFSDLNSAVPSQLSDPIVFDIEDQLWFGYTYLVSINGFSGTGYLYRAPDQVTAEIQADKPSLVFCYGDSLTLNAEPDLANYVWPDGSNAASYRLFDADTVEVAVQGDDQCFYYDTLRVNVQKVYEKERVCAVSVDTSGKNIIIWQRTRDVGTEAFHIYRKLATDSFEFIDQVPFATLSVFEDTDVDPTQQSVEYKISAVDTCGNESGKSFFHRTLHLQLGKGLDDGDINLIWTAYKGLDFPHYFINRGSHPDSMSVLTTVAHTPDKEVYTYTDKGVFDTVYYRVTIPLVNPCAPAVKLVADGTAIKAGTGPYQHALSNMDNNKKLITTAGDLSAIELAAYPNPFTDVSRLEFPNPYGTEYRLSVYSLGGNLVREISGIRTGELYIERENLSPGYYVFELKGEKLYRGKFVIK